MNIKTLSTTIIAFFILLSVSCSNEPKEGSGSSQDSVSLEDTSSDGNSRIDRFTITKKYDIKSGIVYYGTEQKGFKEIIYFDDFGAKELTETITEREIKGIKTKKTRVTLIKDGFKYSYAHEEPVRKDKPVKKEIKKRKLRGIVSLDMISSAYTMSDKMKKEVEYKEEGTETIIGFKGLKYSMKIKDSKITFITYKKVLLKSVREKTILVAEKFEENATIPADKFELPKDYTIKEKKN